MTTPDPELDDPVPRRCLLFFGATTASVSHEIKNKLAVINEKAGLLHDLALAMKAGREVDPDRLEDQASRIVAQVKLADAVVRSLNRLAHSADVSRASVDAAELVGLVAELNGRKASMAGVAIDTADLTGPAPLVTDPFLFEAVVDGCLDVAIAKADATRSVAVSVEATDRGAIVRFRNLTDVGDVRLRLGGADCDPRIVMDHLRADLTAVDAGNQLALEVVHLEARDSGSQS